MSMVPGRLLFCTADIYYVVGYGQKVFKKFYNIDSRGVKLGFS